MDVKVVRLIYFRILKIEILNLIPLKGYENLFVNIILLKSSLSIQFLTAFLIDVTFKNLVLMEFRGYKFLYD